MAVSPKLIKQLREQTGTGLMDCKEALEQCDADIEKATNWLRKKGLSKASKVSGKIAAEGLVHAKIDGDLALIVEVNSETDFVAKNEHFISFVDNISDLIIKNKPKDVESFKLLDLNGKTYEDILGEATAKIGEKIDLRRFAILKGKVGCYVHSNGRIASIISADSSADLAPILKDISMHIAAMNPQYLNADALPQDLVEKEKEIAREQLKKEGKPEAIWDKIIPGKIARFARDVCLFEQDFVKDEKKSVIKAFEEFAKNLDKNAKITGFVRYEVGEGLEKKQEDFASEVAQQLGNK